MKKSFFMIVSFIVLSLVMFSCKKEDNEAEKFSTKSVEENKAAVEQSGVDFVSALGRMESLQGISVLVNLENITSSGNVKGFLFSPGSKLFSTIDALAAARQDGFTQNIMNALVAPAELKSAEPESIQEFWDQNVGTYNWNKITQDWDITTGGDKFIFKFPSTETSQTNNATLTIYNYHGVQISNPADEDYTGDLPVSLNADLKVGSSTLMTFVYAGSYNNEGVPSAIATDLTLETFKYEIDITNNTQVVSVNYKLTENNTVIFDMGAAGNGLFTQDNWDNNTTTHTETHQYIYDYVWNSSTQSYQPVYGTYTEEYQTTDFEEIINSANAHFQLLNMALRGDVNIKGLADQIKIIEDQNENGTITSAQADNQTVIKINEFLNLRLVNATTNEIIAKAEAYVAHDTYSNDSYIDFRLIFGDGSPVDMETYFNEGFDDFISALNGLIDDINADYGTDLQPVPQD